MSTSFKSAFSLLELLVVLVIVGIVLAIGVPGINKARADAELETMRARAVSVQSAKLSFVDAVGNKAAANLWNGKSDDARYKDLLKQYLPATYPAELSDLFKPPFSVNLGAQVGDNVTFMAPDASGTSVATSLQKY